MAAPGQGARAVLFAVVAACGAVSVAFFLSATVDVPLFWYDPVLRALHFGHRPSSVAIDWYGRTALSLATGFAAFGATWAAARRKAVSPELLRLALTWALVAFLLCAGFYAYSLWGRVAPPEPLPPWYQPR